MSLGIAPVTDSVSIAEAQRSGLAPAKRSFNEIETAKLKAFGDQHAGKYKPPPAATPKPVRDAAVVQPNASAQVSAEELANANAARGVARVSSGLFRAKNTSKALYQLLFSSDDVVFEADLKHLLDAVKKKAKTRADMDLTIPQEQRDLRNFLLADFALGDDYNLPKQDIRIFQTYCESLLKPSGVYIREIQRAFSAGEEIGLLGVQLRDVVKSYQSPELVQFNETPDMLSLFKMIKKSVVGDNYIREIKRMQRKFSILMKRDKTALRSLAAGSRQSIMLSMVRRLDTLTATYHLHQKFLSCCAKSGMKGLPTTASLMEFCLQTISGSDVLGGTNGLIRLASLVSARLIPSRNIFMANYNRMIMQSDLLAPHYRSPNIRRQIGESIDKSMKATGVLAAKVKENAD